MNDLDACRAGFSRDGMPVEIKLDFAEIVRELYRPRHAIRHRQPRTARNRRHGSDFAPVHRRLRKKHTCRKHGGGKNPDPIHHCQ